MSDPYVNETIVNTPFDGVAGSTVFTNYSYHKQALAVVSGSAGAALTAANPKYAGKASLALAGTSSNSFVGLQGGVNVATNWLGTVEMDVRFNAIGKQHGLFALLGQFNNQLFLDLLATNKWQLGTASTTAAVSTVTAVAGRWYNVMVACQQTAASAGVMTLYIDGVAAIALPQSTGVPPFSTLTAIYCGEGTSTPGAILDGQVANLRITAGICRQTANFTPPTAPFDTTLPGLTYTASATLIHYNIPTGVMPAVQGMYAPLTGLVHDYIHGGTGKISGTTTTKNTPTNTPVSSKVRLYGERDGILISEQWSSAVDGAYSFNNVDITKKYTVITYDQTHTFRAVIADNLTPDPMP